MFCYFKVPVMPITLRAPLLLLLSGNSLKSFLIWAQIYVYRQGQKVMDVDVSGSESDVNISGNDLSEDEGQGPVNAYGSPIQANYTTQNTVLRRESEIATAVAVPSTSNNADRVVRISLTQLCVLCKFSFV